MTTDEHEDLVESLLRYLRGRGPRPTIENLPVEKRAEARDLMRLLAAIIDADEIDEPPIDEDPLAIRLGLVGPSRLDASAEQDLKKPLSHPALDELTRRFAGYLTVDQEHHIPSVNGSSNILRYWITCRTLGEVVRIFEAEEATLEETPVRLSGVFGQLPTTTAVAVVSRDTQLAVVLTEADCVAAIDPGEGWVDPALPRRPEPLELALGRYLELALPRWDEVARLDETLAFADADSDLRRCVETALTSRLSKRARIPAKLSALESLRDLAPDPIQAIVADVRAHALSGDELVVRLRQAAGVDTP